LSPAVGGALCYGGYLAKFQAKRPDGSAKALAAELFNAPTAADNLKPTSSKSRVAAWITTHELGTIVALLEAQVQPEGDPRWERLAIVPYKLAHAVC